MILTAIGKGANAGALYPDFVGRRAIFVGSGVGPTSASSLDPVSLALSNYYIDSVLGGGSTDGLTYVEALPNGTGPRATWSLAYYNLDGTRNTGNLSTKTFVVSAFVGQF
jgi:hypothetical protein